MKTGRIPIAVVLSALACAPRPAQEPETLGATDRHPCEMPHRAPAPTASMTEFAEFSWNLFIAANWPADTGARGVPNCNLPIGAPVRTVWETYKTVHQIFLAGARDPGPWDTGPSAELPTLRFVSKAPGELPFGDSIRQAVGGWLIDRYGQPTYYHIAANRVAYDYIRANRYYDATVLDRARDIAFPNGALEVKGAWRIVRPEEESRYHTMRARVMTFDDQGNPTGRYVEATLGLVGMHLVFKAPGFPQWVWATFEHVDNAPDASNPTGTWAYYDPSCTGPYCEPNVSPISAKIPFGVPNRLTRLSPIRPEVAAVNTKRQATLANTPFRYYQLVTAQWPTRPNDPGAPQGEPTPGTSANLTMESYIQPISSCMDCHSSARVPNSAVKTNYSFLFLYAQYPQEVSEP